MARKAPCLAAMRLTPGPRVALMLLMPMTLSLSLPAEVLPPRARSGAVAPLLLRHGRGAAERA